MNLSEPPLPVELPLGGRYSAVAILVAVCWVVPLGNLWLLVTVCQGKQLRRPLYILMTNIFIADFLLALFPIPLNISTLLFGSAALGSIVCYMQAYMTSITIATSSLTIGAVSVYRLLQVVYPTAYYRVSTYRCLSAVCCALWIYPFIFLLLCNESVEYVEARYACNFTGSLVYTIKPFVIYFPITVIVPSCYIKICVVSRKVGQARDVPANASVRSLIKKRDNAVFRSITIIFAEFLLFFILPSILHVLKERSEYLILVSFVVFRVHIAVRTCTSLLLNKELRTEAKASCHKFVFAPVR